MYIYIPIWYYLNNIDHIEYLTPLYDLHSNMVLLKSISVTLVPILWDKFTFQYGTT